MTIEHKEPQALRFNTYFEKESNRLFLLPTIAAEKEQDGSLLLWHLTVIFLCYHQTFTMSKQL